MPTFPISLFIDKDLYAKRKIVGYKSDFKTPRYTYATNAYVGKVYSFSQNPTTKEYYLLVYATTYDYNNFIPTFVKINSSDIRAAGLDDAIKTWEQGEQDKQNTAQIAEKGYLRYYIEKYAPVIIGIFAAGFIIPKLLKNDK